MKRHVKEYPVKLMCKVLRVSRSGYYAWRHRPPCRRRQRALQLIEQIRSAYASGRGAYGSPRVTVELKAGGTAACANTIAKYMRQMGLKSLSKRRFVPRTTDSNHPHPVAANLLDRQFHASSANTRWTCDITYLWTAQGWLYLAVVMDLFSRKIVGWNMTEHLRSELVSDALRMALRRRRPRAALLHHSDRGVQYACRDYQALLAGHGITCSMSRVGNCYDNAVTESFFGTLKTEHVHHQQYQTRAQAKASVFEWIEVFYNRQRRHSSLGYVSPETFEAQNN
jgi:transposase InsO family protein